MKSRPTTTFLVTSEFKRPPIEGRPAQLHTGASPLVRQGPQDLLDSSHPEPCSRLPDQDYFVEFPRRFWGTFHQRESTLQDQPFANENHSGPRPSLDILQRQVSPQSS